MRCQIGKDFGILAQDFKQNNTIIEKEILYICLLIRHARALDSDMHKDPTLTPLHPNTNMQIVLI